eukprot:TRINITY_DN3518_c0_g3_i2.p1 TRINITY_DN3518_c0_g3~~TRINITY_DN3518_c0_g3_i2.p1  ORF type:complete len:598 (-),score=268.80 TRINITY_DN3518_c0_g3_i2:559-2352(-)
MDLPQLQNKCKRDPSGYREEFLLQLQHFENQLKIYQLQPSGDYKEFQDQINFLSHVASVYTSDMPHFPNSLCQLLEQHMMVLEPPLRKTIVQALILLRNRNLITSIDLLSLFFKLFRCPDKVLRLLLHRHIISDIKNLNLKHRNNKVNNTLQNFMFGMLQDSSEIAARKSMEIMIELYRRKIWNDIKTVNAISTGLFTKNSKIITAALEFFLGSPELEDSDDEEEDEAQKTKKQKKVHQKLKIGKKTRGTTKKLEKELKRLAKSKEKGAEKYKVNFPAIELIHDPQGYGERVFNALRKSTEKIEVRLMFMNFISRLISVHKLIILNYYPYMQKFVRPKEQNITYILAVLAQSCHELVPPDVLEPVIRILADNFVSDRSSNEAVCIGLNTIREICVRCPLVMNEDLLGDLVQYKKSKDKGVVIAARSLINLFRAINPKLLHKSERGRDADMTIQPNQYGQVTIQSGIEIPENFMEPEDENEDGWESASDDEEEGEESASWVSVDENEEIEVSDDDDEEEGEEGEEEDEENEDEEVEGEEEEEENDDENEEVEEGEDDEEEEEEAESEEDEEQKEIQDTKEKFLASSLATTTVGDFPFF